MSPPPLPASRSEMERSMKRRVALVVGSGSVKCAASLGLYRLLRREGITIDMAVGCSAGALYAAVIALGMEPEEAATLNARLFTREAAEKANRRDLLRAMFPKLFGFNAHWGLKDDRILRARLREGFGDQTFADCRIPLYVTATDFSNGAQVALSEGPLVPALHASVALPFAFPPVPVGDQLLVDGFLSDPLPVGVAVREGADIIIAMGFESAYQERIYSAGRFAMQLSSIMSNNLLKAMFAFHGAAHHSEVILLVPQFTQRIRLFDTDKMPYIMDEGERAMEEHMPYLRRLLATPPVIQPSAAVATA
jgi:NTE family protein